VDIHEEKMIRKNYTQPPWKAKELPFFAGGKNLEI
jgi:hypothetical protein